MILFPLKPYQNSRICVALSGGADSVCLLHYIHSHAAEYHITLSAVTCEHGIRGENSLSDLAFVQSICKNWGIPLFVYRADVPARAKLSGRGLEEEGRIFRYECFQDLLSSQKTDLIATAHHKDDFAETVLFRLIRGTSLAGLNAFPDRTGIIRPLLNVSRAQIMQYVNKSGLSYVTDESNQDQTYTRNYLRHSVLPALEKAVSGASDHLVEFARRAQKDDAFLSALAHEALAFQNGEYRFSANLPYPLFSRAAMEALTGFGVLKDYTEQNIRDITKLQHLQAGRKIMLPSGIEATREGEHIVLYRPQKPFEGELPFKEGLTETDIFRLSITRTKASNALYADWERFPQDCVIRTRRDGDEFTPYNGNKKSLKKYLSDKKIPARKSMHFPLIAKGNVIYAIFGVEISDLVKVTSESKRIAYLTIENK